MASDETRFWTRRRVLAGVATSTSLALLPSGLLACRPQAAGETGDTGTPVEESANLVLPAAVVGMARSEVADAVDLDQQAITALVREAVDLAGGLGDLVHDGDVVVLKPNLVSTVDYSRNPEPVPRYVNGVTTDVRLVRAVALLVRELNPSGTILVMEGSADDSTPHNMAQMGYDPESLPEVDALVAIEATSGGWREFDSPLLVPVELPGGRGRYPDELKPDGRPEYYLNRAYHDADVVISLPCLKTHGNTIITGAVKNVGIGTTPTNIYGGEEGDNRRYVNDGIDHSEAHLEQFIHDFFLCRPPDLSIMDGLQGLQNGPVGSERSERLADDRMNMRLVLAGRDAVALDAVAALIMGYAPTRLDLLQWLGEAEAGVVWPPDIRVAGEQVDEVRTHFECWNARSWQDENGDEDPPALTVHGVEVEGRALHLSVGVEEDVRLELALDGVRLERVVREDFDAITLDVGHLGTGAHTLTLYAYDDALNCTAEERSFDLARA